MKNNTHHGFWMFIIVSILELLKTTKVIFNDQFKPQNVNASWVSINAMAFQPKVKFIGKSSTSTCIPIQLSYFLDVEFICLYFITFNFYFVQIADLIVSFQYIKLLNFL